MTGVHRTRLEVIRTSWFPGGWSHGQEQESGRVSEISNMFDILVTHCNKPENYNRPKPTVNIARWPQWNSPINCTTAKSAQRKPMMKNITTLHPTTHQPMYSTERYILAFLHTYNVLILIFTVLKLFTILLRN